MHSFGRLHLINLWPHQKNSLSLFKYQTPKEKSKQAGKIATLKADVSLFSQLYIVKTDVGTFFQHENNPYIIPTISFRQRKTAPGQKVRLTEVSDTSTWYTHSRFTWDTRPWWWHLSGSLSSACGRGGQLDAGLLSSIEQTPASEQLDPRSTFDTKILDGTAVLHFLPTAGISTFEDYANDVFLPYIRHQLEGADKVDVVWDTYHSSSIKESGRKKRGKGIERKVADPNKIPGKWQEFLKDSDSKQEFFAFLSEKVATAQKFPQEDSAQFLDGKVVLITSGQNVLIRGMDHNMPDNDHEEADTKILLHLQNALQTGSCACLVRTGHWRHRHHHWKVPQTSSNVSSGRDLDCFRHRKVLSHQCHCSSPWRGKVYSPVYSPPHFPQLHRLWHFLCLFWQRKTVCMGCVEMLSCSDRGL